MRKGYQAGRPVAGRRTRSIPTRPLRQGPMLRPSVGVPNRGREQVVPALIHGDRPRSGAPPSPPPPAGSGGSAARVRDTAAAGRSTHRPRRPVPSSTNRQIPLAGIADHPASPLHEARPRLQRGGLGGRRRQHVEAARDRTDPRLQPRLDLRGVIALLERIRTIGIGRGLRTSPRPARTDRALRCRSHPRQRSTDRHDRAGEQEVPAPGRRAPFPSPRTPRPSDSRGPTPAGPTPGGPGRRALGSEGESAPGGCRPSRWRAVDRRGPRAPRRARSPPRP